MYDLPSAHRQLRQLGVDGLHLAHQLSTSTYAFASTSPLPHAVVNQPYSYQLYTTTQPYYQNLAPQGLPRWLTLSSSASSAEPRPLPALSPSPLLRMPEGPSATATFSLTVDAAAPTITQYLSRCLPEPVLLSTDHFTGSSGPSASPSCFQRWALPRRAIPAGLLYPETRFTARRCIKPACIRSRCNSSSPMEVSISRLHH